MSATVGLPVLLLEQGSHKAQALLSSLWSSWDLDVLIEAPGEGDARGA